MMWMLHVQIAYQIAFVVVSAAVVQPVASLLHADDASDACEDLLLEKLDKKDKHANNNKKTAAKAELDDDDDEDNDGDDNVELFAC